MIPRRVSDLVGGTPLLEMPLRGARGRLLLKLEKFNPGGSMKDRMARSMVDAAESAGRLRPGGTIVESSSGNTGTALAMIAAERGYQFIAVVDHHAAKEKIRAMRAYGATIRAIGEELPDNEVATKAREALAEKIAGETHGAVFLNQADNPANARGYERTLGEELWSATGGELRSLVGAVGTGGSLSGTARALKFRNPALHVVGVEPLGSIIFGPPAAPYWQSGTGTPSGVEVGKNVAYSLIDEGRKVDDTSAFTMARFLARERGLLVGGAAAGVVLVALDVARSEPGMTVAIVADGGEKYLDTVFDDEWCETRGLHDEAMYERLKTMLPR